LVSIKGTWSAQGNPVSKGAWSGEGTLVSIKGNWAPKETRAPKGTWSTREPGQQSMEPGQHKGNLIS